MTTTTTDRVRALNDELRQHLLGGGAVITAGVAALGAEFVNRVVRTIAIFDDFCHANDPHRRAPMDVTLGSNRCSISRRFASSVEPIKLTPVTFPPGRFRLAMRPFRTGSAALIKTMGMLSVRVFAAMAGSVPPGAKMAATRKLTSSAASVESWL